MIRKPVVLITGAGGEIGHGLITRLAEEGTYSILALDIRTLPAELEEKCTETIVGNILDANLLERIASEYEVSGIFHLAAMLSTRGEFTPETAHDINVQGTLNLLKLAVSEARNAGTNVRFIFPSSIAVYGLPSVAVKKEAGSLAEEMYLEPTTMYGVNKLACEHLGRYYAHHYRQLAVDRDQFHVDFRSIRFPGRISADTIPSAGTSDYVPEMLHAAAEGKPYACFARPDTRIPFMAMPDAVASLLALFNAPEENLSSTVYNVTSFSPSAEEVQAIVLNAFPKAEIGYEIDEKRQGILDTWPEEISDERARNDWGWMPEYDLERAFQEYLIPKLVNHYAVANT